MVERSLSMREVPGSIPGASKRFFLSHLSPALSTFMHVYAGGCMMQLLLLVLLYKVRPKKVVLQRPGIEPGPPAWQASILPLNQRCRHDGAPVSFHHAQMSTCWREKK